MDNISIIVMVCTTYVSRERNRSYCSERLLLPGLAILNSFRFYQSWTVTKRMVDYRVFHNTGCTCACFSKGFPTGPCVPFVFLGGQ